MPEALAKMSQDSQEGTLLSREKLKNLKSEPLTKEKIERLRILERNLGLEQGFYIDW